MFIHSLTPAVTLVNYRMFRIMQ